MKKALGLLFLQYLRLSSPQKKIKRLYLVGFFFFFENGRCRVSPFAFTKGASIFFIGEVKFDSSPSMTSKAFLQLLSHCFRNLMSTRFLIQSDLYALTLCLNRCPNGMWRCPDWATLLSHLTGCRSNKVKERRCRLA